MSANKKNNTIIAPQMSPIHFEILQMAFKSEGYNIVLLPDVDKGAVDIGLKYVNNDSCYPSILTVGQIMKAITSGEYDVNNTSIFMAQTGGGCRASNYVALIRKALRDAHLDQVPVVSISSSGIENNPGFSLTRSFLNKAIMAIVYGDLLLRVVQATRPYEKEKGAAEQLHRKWKKIACLNVSNGNLIKFRKNINKMIGEFDEIERMDIIKPKVGIVGEILIKYHPMGNNQIVKTLEEEGAEVYVPDLLDFFLYSAFTSKFKYEKLNGKKRDWINAKIFIDICSMYRKPAIKAFKTSRHFSPPSSIEEKAKYAMELISLGNQTGEGWLLTGEMIEMVEHGYENVVCVQPFGCLPNHVVGKSMIKPIREKHPSANIVAIDYDPGASEVNQLNRLKLMLAAAYKKIDKQIEEAEKEKGYPAVV